MFRTQCFCDDVVPTIHNVWVCYGITSSGGAKLSSRKHRKPNTWTCLPSHFRSAFRTPQNRVLNPKFRTTSHSVLITHSVQDNFTPCPTPCPKPSLSHSISTNEGSSSVARISQSIPSVALCLRGIRSSL